jgi:beta propeller repeat protein
MEPTGRILPCFPALLCLVLCLLLVSPVLAGTETLITTNTTGSDQQAPSISGDWIVWEDTRDAGWDIYGYNIVTGEERRITREGAVAHDPAISGNRVVWQDFRHGNYDIFFTSLVSGTPKQITSGTAEHSAPAIDGNRIVWQDTRNGNFDIYLYDLSSHTETLLTPGAPGADKKYPAIAGSLVVWQDSRNNLSSTDIFMNDTSTGMLVDLTPGLLTSTQMKPAISGTRVVWRDDQLKPVGSIWMNDTSGPVMTRVDNGPPYAKTNRPVVSGTRVVWLDSRNRPPAFYDIYMNDTSTGLNTRITTGDAEISGWGDANGYSMMGPSVSGNRIVWTDFRNENRDIYLYTDGVTESCPAAAFSSSVHFGAPPLPVQFTDTSTPGTTPVSHWHWEFGDGNTSTEQNPLFTYTVPGNYQVRLTVNNPYCRNATPFADTANISVGAAPEAIFTATPANGPAPLTVSFTDSSPGATAWNWSFGDGKYSELQNPAHRFRNPGTYTVVLNASNAYGFSEASQNIYALRALNDCADTAINGITITTPAGRQHLTYDTVQLPGYSDTGQMLISTDPALRSHGWQNITFLSGDGIGFVPSGTLIEGNISGVIFSTREITLDNVLTPETGSGGSLNFSTPLSSYPVGGSLCTRVWEGALPADLGEFRRIATLSGFGGLEHLAYTIRVTKSGFPTEAATIHFNVNSSWVSRLPDGRTHVYLERISDDRATGEAMTADFLYSDTSRDLDFFETRSPRGFSTLGVSLLSGTGNPFQLITLSVTSHVDPPTGNPSGAESEGAKGGGAGSKVTTVPTPTPTTLPVQALDPGTSAKVYTNARGVVTQATLLRSTDGLAAITLAEGVVAKDAGGNPLTGLSMKAIPAGSLPAVPAGSAFRFAGMAYDLGPGGATFSPPVNLTFTLPQARTGVDYTVKSFDGTSGTWQDLPTSFDAATGVVTVQVPHLCPFALFTISAGPSGTVAATPRPVPEASDVKAQPPKTAVSVFISMIGWAAGLVMSNAFLLVAIIILAGAVYLIKQGRYPGSGR